MRCSISKDNRSKIHAFRNPKDAIRTSSGFAYIALLVVIIIIGISLGAAGKYWSNVMLRDKEDELLFRGEQYRQAIVQYKKYLGRNHYPPSIDDLLKDSRSAVGRRYLRQKFKDPITGDDFLIIKNSSLRIIGVHSSSDKLSLKQGGFPVTMKITGQAGVPIIVPPSNPTGVTEPTFINQTDDTELSSTTTATIKYSDWLFVSISGTLP